MAKTKEAKPIGEVIHFFSKINVAVVKFSKPFTVGQKVHFKGHSTDFEQVIDSMQIDYKPVEKVKAKEEAAMKVDDKVREGDGLFVEE